MPTYYITDLDQNVAETVAKEMPSPAPDWRLTTLPLPGGKIVKPPVSPVTGRQLTIAR